MAWIKMRTELMTSPKVIAIASGCKVHPAAVCGACFALWSLADQHTTDGRLQGYNADFLDAYAGIQGFANMAVRVGWLEVAEDGIIVPNFERHNSSSAKARALGADRVKRHRNAQTVSDAFPREEKRREEKHQQHQHVAAVAADRPREDIGAERLLWADNLAKRPEWLPEDKPWIGRDTWLGLAIEAPNLTADQFQAIIKEARGSRQFLRNPAGLIIKRIREHAKKDLGANGA